MGMGSLGTTWLSWKVATATVPATPSSAAFASPSAAAPNQFEEKSELRVTLATNHLKKGDWMRRKMNRTGCVTVEGVWYMSYIYILKYRFSWCIPLDSNQMIWVILYTTLWNVAFILKNSCPWNLSCFVGWRLYIGHIRSDWKVVEVWMISRIWEVTCLLKKLVLWSVHSGKLT